MNVLTASVNLAVNVSILKPSKLEYFSILD